MVETYKFLEYNNEITQLDENGKNKLYKDKDALKEFERYVKDNSKSFPSEYDRFKYMVEEGYYDKDLGKVPEEVIERLTEKAYAKGFEFQSFMACQQFYDKYSIVKKHLNTQTKQEVSRVYLENYEQHNVRVALFFYQDDYEKAEALLEQLMEQTFQPATPSYFNGGKGKRGELSSCYLFVVDDSLDSMNFVSNNVKQASKVGGGCAVDVTRIRPQGATVNGNPGASKGIIPFIKDLENGLSHIDQGGTRPGAGAVYLNIFHLDVMDFLDAKKINADEGLRLSTISTGLTVPDKFMELVKEDGDFYTFDTYDTYIHHGKYIDEIDFNVDYDKLVDNPNIRKRKYKARDMMNKIAQTQIQSGYPYIFFIDTANDNHPLKGVGKVRMSNLCTEISQLQEISDIKPMMLSEENVMGRDVVCTLGSLNVVNVVEKGLLEESVHVGIETLTRVTDLMYLPQLPSVQKANNDLRAIGLGTLNLHGLLAKNMVSYGSREALDIVNSLYSAIRYYAIQKSMELAKERNNVFYGFDKSEYANGNVFKPYIEKDHTPRTEKAKNVLSKVYIPTKEDWEALAEDVKKYGMYNGYLLTTAPTQSISYVQNATSSIMPVVSPIELRKYGNSEAYYPMPYMSAITQFFYENETAYKLDNKKIINTSAIVQKHTDQAVSTILFVESEISTAELSGAYYYAWEKGLKSLYYTRSAKSKVVECESCSV